MGTNLRAPYASFMRRLQHLAHNSVWKHILLIKRARQIEGHGRSTGVERQHARVEAWPCLGSLARFGRHSSGWHWLGVVGG